MIYTVVYCDDCKKEFARVDSYGKEAIEKLEEKAQWSGYKVSVHSDRCQRCQTIAEVCNKFSDEELHDQNGDNLRQVWIGHGDGRFQGSKRRRPAGGAC